ncbi:hypothetical protein M8542_42595 [Amycolatopsis sp. OK19-0408]|uniref:PPE family protein n=1 Tax=Amycolatopsis iheyensis TaxID=2945988 RepID=A0A9X2NN75_9PSEU|nr:hypothetical protein [Amycolatopsis iheyensis]MCR6489527.1 hypothetical protein [Amycolatopsis iheyensis]
MGLFGDMLDAAKHVGSEIAHTVESGAEGIGKVMTGAGIGALAGGPIGAVAGAYVASQTGTGAANPQAAGLSPGQLVQAVMRGPGTGSLQSVHQAGVDQSTYQRRLEQGTRELTSGLESAWTGGASDAARERLQPLTASATSASTTLDRNSTLAQTQIDQFHLMKNSLHPDVTDQPPTRSAWDVATPWDTDTEDKINQYNQKASENVERYNAYSQQSSSNTANRTIDYGQLREYTGGDFTVEDPKDPVEPPKKRARSDVGGGDDRSIGSQVQPPPAVHPPVQPVQPPGQVTPPPGSVPPGVDDSVRAQGYVPPTSTQFPPGYQPPGTGPGFGPGSGPGAGGGFGPGFGVGGGFGPGSGSGPGGFGPGSSGTSSGSRGPGASTGAGALGEGRPGTAGGMRPGATGKPGSSGMGGMGHGAKGGKSEDEEHQRASYLVEADPESVFGGSDERTVPPVIGL